MPKSTAAAFSMSVKMTKKNPDPGPGSYDAGLMKAISSGIK